MLLCLLLLLLLLLLLGAASAAAGGDSLVVEVGATEEGGAVQFSTASVYAGLPVVSAFVEAIELSSTYPSLFPLSARQRLVESSGMMPVHSFAVGRFSLILETRLGGAGEQQVDYSIQLQCPTCLLAAMDGPLAALVARHGEWQRLQSFLRFWHSHTGEADYSECWLEFDDRTGDPIPSVFLIPRGLRRDANDYEPVFLHKQLSLLNSSMAVLLGHPPPPPLLAAVERVYFALPPRSTIFSFGVWLGRQRDDGDDAIRVECLPFPNTAEAIMSFLAAIGWPGDEASLRPLVAALVAVTSNVVLGLDIGAGGVGGRIGLQGYNLNQEPSGRPLQQQQRPVSWVPLVDYLCQNQSLFRTDGASRCEEARRITADHPHYMRPSSVAINSSIAALEAKQRQKMTGEEQQEQEQEQQLVKSAFGRVTHLKAVYTAAEQQPFEVKLYFELRAEMLADVLNHRAGGTTGSRLYANKAGRLPVPSG